MKTPSNDDVDLTSKNNASDPKHNKPTIMHSVKGFKKKTKHFPIPPFIFDDSDKSNWLSMKKLRSKWMLLNCSQKSRMASIRARKINTHKDEQHLQHDPTMDLPSVLYITYCEGCQSYSQTGRKKWFKVPLASSDLMNEFLVSRIKFHMHILRLKLIDSWIVERNPDDACKSAITLGLLLEYQAPSGDCNRKTCEVLYKVAHKTSSDCSELIPKTHLCSVVELRQYACHNRTLNLLQLRILSNQVAASTIQKIKHTEHGMDIFFSNYLDAATLIFFLTTQAPVKCNEIGNRIMSSDCSSNDSFTMSIISLIVCPIYPDDLVYLPSMILDTLGLQHMGPLAICTGLSSTIQLLNPLNLKQCVVDNDDYWRIPFEPVKSVIDLVEYIVYNVQIVSSEGAYALADVQVARESDFGKKDATVLARTHLGHVLKPGDHAFGYDLHDLNIIVVEMEKFQNMLPDVVLIKKKFLTTDQPQGNSRQQRIPEYAQFLKDLESNPEALFNLSLKGGDGMKQNSETFSENPEDLKLELEDLLADLDLNDRENTGRDV